MKQVMGPVAANTWLLFLLLPVIIMVPVLLLIIIPAVIVITIVLGHKPKPRPYTLDDWWEDNWKNHL